jgi:hypothetical protein
MISDTTEKEIPKTEKVPKWLKRVQKNSWEIEVLISGGAIFTLLQISELLARQKVFFSENAPFVGLDEVLVFSMLATEGVTFCFILHLLFRGLWTALLCVNGSFPLGVNREKLRLSDLYFNKNKSLTLTSEIILLDKISGLIFWAGFAFVIFVAGLVITPFVLMAIIGLLPWMKIPLFSLLIIYFIDFALSGPLRKNHIAGKFYRPVYLFFNAITLGFLYRKTVQVVFSNVQKTPTIIFLALLFVSTSLLSYLSLFSVLRLPSPLDWRRFSGTEMNSDVVYSDVVYLDRISQDENIRWGAIQSDIIETNYMKVFVNYTATYDNGINEQNATSFDAIVKIVIDGDTLKNIDWFNQERFKAKQKGILGVIPIHQLAPGKHLLTLYINDYYYFKRKAPLTIPFWKE